MCSLLLPTPLTCLTGAWCKSRQGIALQHWANDPVGQMQWKCCHWLCWSLCDESLLCSFGYWEIWQKSSKPSMKNRKWFWLNDGWAAVLCSKNHVDVHCSGLTTPRGSPPMWISSTLFLQTWDLGQDEEQIALGAAVCNGERVPVLRVLLHCRLLPASGPPQSACYKKSLNPKPNLRLCCDTNNNEEFVKVLKWKESFCNFFGGGGWDFFFFNSSVWFCGK